MGSINRQYGQAAQDTTGFTKAVVSLLAAQAGKADPYGSAVSSQTAADNAAVARLQALGLGGAGAAAAVGGMGDSALGSLNASRGATGAYLSKMPGVAAATGQAGLRAIQSAKSDAIQQRQETYRSALVQAEQQLQQFALSKAQLNQSDRQFAATQAYQYAALRQNANQFSASQKQDFVKFMMEQKRLLSEAGATSPAAQQALRQEGVAATQSYAMHGVPFQGAVRDLMHAHGIGRKLAIAIVSEAYSQVSRPDRAHYYDKNGVFDNAGFHADLTAYNRTFRSFHAFLKNGWMKSKKPAAAGASAVGPPLSYTRSGHKKKTTNPSASTGGVTNRYGNF
jgi:hypothetical protein